MNVSLRFAFANGSGSWFLSPSTVQPKNGGTRCVIGLLIAYVTAVT